MAPMMEFKIASCLTKGKMSSGTCRIFSALSNEVYKSMSHVMPSWSVIVSETRLSCDQPLLHPCLSWSGSRSVLSLWPDRFKQLRALHVCRVEHNWFVLVVVFLRYGIDNWHHLLQHRGRSCTLRRGKSYFSPVLALHRRPEFLGSAGLYQQALRQSLFLMPAPLTSEFPTSLGSWVRPRLSSIFFGKHFMTACWSKPIALIELMRPKKGKILMIFMFDSQMCLFWLSQGRFCIRSLL